MTKIDKNEMANENVLCRFCWGSEFSLLNPLLSSCKCNGGIKYVHYQCLKEWLNSKRQVKEYSTVATLMYKIFECELCKTPYPLFFKVGNRKYSLVDSPKRTGSYLTLDMLTLEPNFQRIIHIFQPSQLVSKVEVGRGHEADMRLGDISVSRSHAVLKLKNQSF